MLSVLVAAQLFSPPLWRPQIHQDGSKTWTIEVSLTKHHPSGPDRAERIAAAFLGQHNFCLDGWEITNQHEAKKRLTIEGRCK